MQRSLPNTHITNTQISTRLGPDQRASPRSSQPLCGVKVSMLFCRHGRVEVHEQNRDRELVSRARMSNFDECFLWERKDVILNQTKQKAKQHEGRKTDRFKRSTHRPQLRRGRPVQQTTCSVQCRGSQPCKRCWRLHWRSSCDLHIHHLPPPASAASSASASASASSLAHDIRRGGCGRITYAAVACTTGLVWWSSALRFQFASS